MPWKDSMKTVERGNPMDVCTTKLDNSPETTRTMEPTLQPGLWMDVDHQSQNTPTFPLVKWWMAHLSTQMVANDRNNLPFATLYPTSSTDWHRTSHPQLLCNWIHLSLLIHQITPKPMTPVLPLQSLIHKLTEPPNNWEGPLWAQITPKEPIRQLKLSTSKRETIMVVSDSLVSQQGCIVVHGPYGPKRYSGKGLDMFPDPASTCTRDWLKHMACILH